MNRIDNYKSFFADQVKEEVREQQKINRSTMRQLFRTGDLSLAYVETIQRETGMVVLKFPRRMAPSVVSHRINPNSTSKNPPRLHHSPDADTFPDQPSPNLRNNH